MNSATLTADQAPNRAIRLSSPDALVQLIARRPGLSARSASLVRAVRAAVVTDPSAGGVERLRFLAGRLRDAVERQGICPRVGSASGTIPGLTKRFDAQDQYFLITRATGVVTRSKFCSRPSWSRRSASSTTSSRTVRR